MPGPQPPAAQAPSQPRGLAASIALALGWVLLATVSLAVSAVALLTTLILAKSAHVDGGWAVPALLAITATLIVPFGIVTWKHEGDPWKILNTMAWFPALWNAAGLVLATTVIPDVTAASLRNLEWVVQGRFGDSHSATRAMSALGHEAGDWLDPPPPTFPVPRAEAGVALDRALMVPFADHGTAITLDVTLAGPSGDIESRYLFDTGASFTTITSSTAEAIGLEIPDNAPTLRFNTAAGPRESRMIHLPAIRVGDVEVENVLVSVCDSCGNEHTNGLLGLNVTREFFVQMDYQAQQMQLLPRIHPGAPNRAYDIEPVVKMEIEGKPEIWLGRVRWVVEVENRGTQPIHGLVPEIRFGPEGPLLLGEVVDEILPGDTGRSLVVGKVTEHESGKSLEFTIAVAEAYW